MKHFLELDAFLHDQIISSLDYLKEQLPALEKTVYIFSPMMILLFITFKSVSLIFEGDSLPMENIFSYAISSVLEGPIGFTIESTIINRFLLCDMANIIYLMFLSTPIVRKFEMEVIRKHAEFDQLSTSRRILC